MKYPITQQAQKLMDAKGIKPEDLSEVPVDGKKFTKQDVLLAVDAKEQAVDPIISFNAPSDPLLPEEVEPLIIEEEESPVKESFTKADITTTVEDSPLYIEIFWEDRKRAEALEKSGKYTITASHSIKNALYGRHKKLVLKRNY